MAERFKGIDPCLGKNYRASKVVETKPTASPLMPQRGEPDRILFWRGSQPIPEGFKPGPVFV